MWRQLTDYPLYEISDEKQIRNIKTKRLLTERKRVDLYQNKVRKTVTVETLYKQTFPELQEIVERKIAYSDDEALLPDIEPQKLEVIEKLAHKIVLTGHQYFYTTNAELQPLWNEPVNPNENRIVLNGMTYDDLIQEAILKMYEIANTTNPENPIPLRYLTTAVRNHFLSFYQDKDPLNKADGFDRTGYDGEDYDLLEIYEPDEDLSDFGVSDSIIEKLQWLRSKLNRQDYEIIYYYYGHELTMEQIANKVGLTRQTISGRIKHIVAKIQKELGKDR